jgi:hypothetical protein
MLSYSGLSVVRNSLKEDIFCMTAYSSEPVLCPGECFKAYQMQEVQKTVDCTMGKCEYKDVVITFL